MCKRGRRNRRKSISSGLAMHMECGACKGGVGVFREVTRYVEIRKMGFVGIRLLG